MVLAAAIDARDAVGWSIDETSYWVVLPVIFLWALSSLVWITRPGMAAPTPGQR